MIVRKTVQGSWEGGSFEGVGTLVMMLGDYQAKYQGSWTQGKQVSSTQSNTMQSTFLQNTHEKVIPNYLKLNGGDCKNIYLQKKLNKSNNSS